MYNELHHSEVGKADQLKFSTSSPITSRTAVSLEAQLIDLLYDLEETGLLTRIRI